MVSLKWSRDEWISRLRFDKTSLACEVSPCCCLIVVLEYRFRRNCFGER